MDPGFRELIDALKSADAGMNAQAQGHHNVVEAVHRVEDAIARLEARFEAAEAAKTAEALSELAKQQAIVNDREQRSDAFHREIIETTGSVVSSTVRSAGNFLTSRTMVGLYGFLSYALMSWFSGCFGSPKGHELMDAWSKFWVGGTFEAPREAPPAPVVLPLAQAVVAPAIPAVPVPSTTPHQEDTTP